jgi:hypothetical protein
MPVEELSDIVLAKEATTASDRTEEHIARVVAQLTAKPFR